ncbi:MAG TPA: NADPH-dependent F420 reductase [Methanospirillum sp.]|nr:NADPH-dependent F420 reductase [Methanospirillum sp.]
MKVGIIGGTGKIGEGIAMRLSCIFDVLVGSRDEQKAQLTCENCLKTAEMHSMPCSVEWVSNQDAVIRADVIILAIPYKHLDQTIQSLTGFEGKIVISPVNPMERREYFEFTPPTEGSAALHLKTILPDSARICTAFNNISGNRWRAIDEELDYSVAVCGDDQEAKEIVIDLVDRISLLKAYDAGPLSISPIIEGLTPLLNNIARFNHMKDVGVRFI